MNKPLNAASEKQQQTIRYIKVEESTDRWLRILGLNEIAALEKISTAARNICKKNGFTDLEKMIGRWKTGKGFLELKNCGPYLAKELDAVCLKYYLLSPSKLLEFCITHDGSKSLKLLDAAKRKRLSTFITGLSATLTGRIKNTIIKLLEKETEACNFLNHFKNGVVDRRGDALIGRITKKELAAFKTRLIEYFILMHIEDRERFISHYLKLILDIYGKGIVCDPDNLIEGLKNSSGKIYLFSFINTLVDLELFLTPQKRQIFDYLYLTHSNKIEEIRRQIELSDYLVDQSVLYLENNLQSLFGLVSELDLDEFAGFNLGTENNIVVVNEVFVKERSVNEKVKFANTFYASIMILFLHNSYSLFKQLPGRASRWECHRPKKLKNGYLIRKEWTNVFDFTSYISSLYKIVGLKRMDDFNVSFDSYLKDFTASPNYEIDVEIKRVCETILFEEFGVTLVKEHLYLPRVAKKYLKGKIYEALTELRMLSKLSTICSVLQKMFPDYEIKESSVKWTLIKYKEIFFSVGTENKYGLKKWETELPDMKGGTIRAIAKEYLDKFPHPVHRDEIFSYVRQFRKTSNANIRGNLRLKGKFNFVWLEGGLIGLEGKDYGENPSTKKLKTNVHIEPL